jgi:hypothetical protein
MYEVTRCSSKGATSVFSDKIFTVTSSSERVLSFIKDLSVVTFPLVENIFG